MGPIVRPAHLMRQEKDLGTTTPKTTCLIEYSLKT